MSVLIAMVSAMSCRGVECNSEMAVNVIWPQNLSCSITDVYLPKRGRHERSCQTPQSSTTAVTGVRFDGPSAHRPRVHSMCHCKHLSTFSDASLDLQMQAAWHDRQGGHVSAVSSVVGKPGTRPCKPMRTRGARGLQPTPENDPPTVDLDAVILIRY